MMQIDIRLYMTNEERWTLFISELRAYIEEHHHGPLKHTSLLNQIKYTRKKIKEGKLDEEKVQESDLVMGMRDMTEHTGGRRFRFYSLWFRDV